MPFECYATGFLFGYKMAASELGGSLPSVHPEFIGEIAIFNGVFCLFPAYCSNLNDWIDRTNNLGPQNSRAVELSHITGKNDVMKELEIVSGILDANPEVYDLTFMDLVGLKQLIPGARE